ncbi:MAG: cytochrome c-type biogenesis protein CcmH [Cellvibrionaceae bacterium]|nr:cytochrome c-type biogenesis protein CcmH [Cellvibrionaceae bacterium]
MLTKICLAWIVVFAVPLVFAEFDVFEFANDEERVRFQALVAELRCPKCQNQNLADSNSQIAIDLRNEVYRMLKEQKSDEEIKDFLVDRYGDFVLYRPPVQSNTLVLWWAPAVMLGLGVLVFAFIVVQRSRVANKASKAAKGGSES